MRAYYDDKDDIFVIHKGFAQDERFKGNIDVGDLILDLSTRGRIRGLEILNASDFLKGFKISEEMLKTMETADFNASIKPNGIIVDMIIKSKLKTETLPARIMLPLESPVLK